MHLCLMPYLTSDGALSRGSEGIALWRDELVFRDTRIARHRHGLEAIQEPLARFVGPDHFARPLAALARRIDLLHGQIPPTRMGAVQRGRRVQWHAGSLDGHVNTPDLNDGARDGPGKGRQRPSCLAVGPSLFCPLQRDIAPARIALFVLTPTLCLLTLPFSGVLCMLTGAVCLLALVFPPAFVLEVAVGTER